MKVFVKLILGMVFVGNVQATEAPSVITGTLEDVFCGEMDPFAVGDACVIFTTDELTGKKYGLVYGDYDWATVHVPEIDSATDMVGDQFQASTCEKIYDSGVISVLKRFKPDYFYLDCYVYDFNWL